jgi:hypothetical protein
VTYSKSFFRLSVTLHVLIVRRIWRVDLKNEKHIFDAVGYSLGELIGITNKPGLHLFHLTFVMNLVEFDILASALQTRDFLLELRNLFSVVELDLVLAWRHLIQITFEYL